MKCKRCGADIPDVAIFCPVCGVEQQGKEKGSKMSVVKRKVFIFCSILLAGIIAVIWFVFTAIPKPTEQEVIAAVIAESDEKLKGNELYTGNNMQFFEDGTYAYELVEENFDRKGYYDCQVNVQRYFELVDVYEEISVSMYYDKETERWYADSVSSSFCSNDWKIAGEWETSVRDFSLVFEEEKESDTDSGGVTVPFVLRDTYGYGNYEPVLERIGFDIIPVTKLFITGYGLVEIAPEEITVSDEMFFRIE